MQSAVLKFGMFRDALFLTLNTDGDNRVYIVCTNNRTHPYIQNVFRNMNMVFLVYIYYKLSCHHLIV